MFCDGCGRKFRKRCYHFPILLLLRFCFPCALKRSTYYYCANLNGEFFERRVDQLDFFHRSTLIQSFRDAVSEQNVLESRVKGGD